MQIPAVTHWEEGWMFQHRELSATWTQLVLQEKHPVGTWCLCLSQCCHPNCFGNSYLLFMLVAGQAPLNCRHVTHPGCPSGLQILLGLVNAPQPPNSSWFCFWMINLKQNHSSGQMPFCLGSEERLQPRGSGFVCPGLPALGSLCFSSAPWALFFMSFSILSFEEHRPKTEAVQVWPLNLSH